MLCYIGKCHFKYKERSVIIADNAVINKFVCKLMHFFWARVCVCVSTQCRAGLHEETGSMLELTRPVGSTSS